jgi:hypothetical protein
VEEEGERKEKEMIMEEKEEDGGVLVCCISPANQNPIYIHHISQFRSPLC